VNSLGHEQLFIDVANDTIRIIDPESHSVDATARCLESPWHRSATTA
jgi:hypothetical protein